MDRRAPLALLGLGALGVLLILIVFAREYGAAPAVAPVHFSFDGTPDRWGAKSMFLVFPLIGIVFFGIASTIALGGLPRGAVPVPPLLPILATLTFVETIWMLAFAEIGAFDVALGRATALTPVFFVGLGAVILTGGAIVVVAVATAVGALRKGP